MNETAAERVKRHVARAEELAEASEAGVHFTDACYFTDAFRQRLATLAQVHATLALVAETRESHRQ